MAFCRPTRITCFTLLEMIAVIVIILVIVGVVVPRAGRIPAFISLDRNAGQLQELLQDAGFQAQIRGEEIKVLYDREKQLFRLSSGNNSKYTIERTQCEILKPILVRFPQLEEDYEETEIMYYFFADGTASGPEILLTFKGHKKILGVSPLTGLIYARNIYDEDE